MSKVEVFIVMLSVVICAIIASFGSFDAGVKTEQRRAIEAGVAEFQVNPKTGETKFSYLKK